MARQKTLFHAVAMAKKVKLVTDKERKLIDNASYFLKRGLNRDVARSMRALDKYDALIDALYEIEVPEIEEALTSEEMSNLVSALSEWDSYSLVG